MTLLISLKSEFLKVKRTSSPYLLLLTALFPMFISVLDHVIPEPRLAPADIWEEYYLEYYRVFAFLLLPMYTILASTLLLQIEVRNNAWKQLLATPQQRVYILGAKFLVLAVFVFTCIVAFNLFFAAGAFALDSNLDTVGYVRYLAQWRELLLVSLRTFGAALGYTAFCFWMALRFKNFVAPVGIGISMWMISALAAFEFHLPDTEKFFFVLPFTVVSERFENDPLFYQALSFTYFIVFFSLAWFEFNLRYINARRHLNNHVVEPIKSVSLMARNFVEMAWRRASSK